MIRRLLLGLVVFGFVVASAPSAGAQALPDPRARDEESVDRRQIEVQQLSRRVEILSRSGRTDQAIRILEERIESEGQLEDPLARRLARLYRDAGRWSELRDLLLESVDGREEELDVGQARLLVEARFQTGQDEAALATLDRLLAADPEDGSLRRLVANVLSDHDRIDRAIEVLEEGRRLSEDPVEFAQLLGRFHAQRGTMADAVREYCLVIVASPLNVSLVRGQVLELSEEAPDQVPGMLDAARGMATAHPDVPQIGMVVAELQMVAGDADAAWRTLARLVSERDLSQELLRLALAGLADSRLPGSDPDVVLPRLRLSARVARAMLANETVPTSLEPRVYDTLVRSLLAILENDAFGRLDRAEQFDILDETRRSIIEMQQRFAGNKLTSAALLRLAGVYVDTLHEPDPAIELYGVLAADASSSREDVNHARLGLARAHVAAGDTLLARQMFETIGQDMGFVEGQGRAQYHLGMLDFMGGHLATAQDRLKAVAAEAPRAEYTNDALDLALVLVEQELSGSEDDAALRRYGEALYLKSTHQPAALLNTLTEIAEGDPGAVRERARLDLARLAVGAREPDDALIWTDRIASEAPASRYAAQALDLRGELLESLGRDDEALAVYERLVLDYEDYVLMDKVRDRVRSLRGSSDSPEDEELP